MLNDLLQVLHIAAPLTAGLRWYGENFWPQFLAALVISTFAQVLHYGQTSGYPVNLWLIVIFAATAAFMGWAVYWMDKRFKLTHWERDLD